ncbi:host cell division inhibitor Icd-like protein [Pasteurella multocida]|uniref:host cell division inhibitor Icd-like protein n=1 Tax=Pasteurella multocida TaxID=747 RepID=UPI0029BBA17B|nr:host cell division inhibitor Icd-like protein [Pasteurella multocida]MDX3898080.1 host cell division inhibitor Icd-like protein [Pasteurella multocida]MDX3956300.1 host cell division inhibitor Icd-like protein [Pasteurella multocida]
MINKNKANLTPIKTDCNLFTKCDKNFQSFLLTTETAINYIKHALAKSKAEPRNSNDLLVANSSTPILDRAFFVRSLHTPKINPAMDLFSMVACGGKGFALCCVPQVAVFEPVARYRPKASKLQAVTSIKYLVELIAMIYQFLGISRQHYDQTKAEQIRILADNETQARAYLARDYVLISLGRLPNTAKNDRTLTVKGGVYV